MKTNHMKQFISDYETLLKCCKKNDITFNELFNLLIKPVATDANLILELGSDYKIAGVNLKDFYDMYYIFLCYAAKINIPFKKLLKYMFYLSKTDLNKINQDKSKEIDKLIYNIKYCNKILNRRNTNEKKKSNNFRR